MESQPSRGAGIGKAAAFALATASLVAQKVTQDGHLAAFWRQGLDEVGHALKPFPESIQVSEPGAIFEPTQGEVAAARKGSVHGHPSPSQIAASRAGVFGGEHGQTPHRSPSEIAGDRGNVHAAVPGHEPGRDLGHER